MIVVKQHRKAQERSEAAAWSAYERMKNAWLETHPDATPAEYQAAMTRLARECGV